MTVSASSHIDTNCQSTALCKHQQIYFDSQFRENMTLNSYNNNNNNNRISIPPLVVTSEAVDIKYHYD